MTEVLGGGGDDLSAYIVVGRAASRCRIIDCLTHDLPLTVCHRSGQLVTYFLFGYKHDDHVFCFGGRSFRMRVSVRNPTNPDGRYFVVKGQLWRCSNPSLPADVRQSLVDDLMAARREVHISNFEGVATRRCAPYPASSCASPFQRKKARSLSSGPKGDIRRDEE